MTDESVKRPPLVVCDLCGAIQDSHQREYNLDCRCGGTFRTRLATLPDLKLAEVADSTAELRELRARREEVMRIPVHLWPETVGLQKAWNMHRTKRLEALDAQIAAQEKGEPSAPAITAGTGALQMASPPSWSKPVEAEPSALLTNGTGVCKHCGDPFDSHGILHQCFGNRNQTFEPSATPAPAGIPSLTRTCAKCGQQYTANAMACDCHGRIGAPPDAVIEEAALAKFTEYFTKNYPGPHTVITDPKWHAPKIFRAAVAALVAEGWGKR